MKIVDNIMGWVVGAAIGWALASIIATGYYVKEMRKDLHTITQYYVTPVEYIELGADK